MSDSTNSKPVGLIQVPEGYADWLAELKSRIHSAQQRATLAVNRELVLLYWQIGRDILAQQASQGWGAKVIDRLAHDLRAAFPDMKGFSPRNLKYMRAFSEAWPDAEFVQGVLAQLPWYHQLALLDKLPGPETRKWYAAKAIEHNWSRNVLVMQIEMRLLERSGKAVTNFPLPCPRRSLIWRESRSKTRTALISSA
jgi:predicted nuclease of restriction endonuclease-like (RecB) superfamily